ncbi:Detected protein of unknown function [Hibiscus syriacus]|uniref:Uncharacterized protein n=1 Tax=Hibiscus syriacus TaxID=106335 RepID=A0A6A2XB46_HIBSY|nr:Detected protein of unknown function [Hibiscus syriacus]
MDVYVHKFWCNKIEVAYQEAVALKMQEELIREEEAAWMAESEQKAKRAQSEKEKKSKKKQSRQKRNNRKSKYKGREEKAIVAAREKHQEDHHNDENEASVMVELTLVPVMVDVLCDVSDSVDAATDVLQPDSEDRDASPVNWDTNTSEIHPPAEVCTSGISGLSCVQNGVADKRSPSIMDDSSSTCSTDSVPSVVMSVTYKGNSFSNHNKQSLSRGRNQGSKTVSDCSSWTTESDNQPCPALDSGHQNDVSESSKAGELEFEPAGSLSDQKIGPSRILFGRWCIFMFHLSEYFCHYKSCIFMIDIYILNVIQEEVLLQKKPSAQDSVDLERPKENMAPIPSSLRSPPRNLPSVQYRSEYKSAGRVDSLPVRKTSSNCMQHSGQPASSSISVQIASVLKSETQKAATLKSTEKPTTPQLPVMSRPSSAPLIPCTRHTAPFISMVQTTPLLARSVNVVGRLGHDPSPEAIYVPQCYRNAIISLPLDMVIEEAFRDVPHSMERFRRGSTRSMHSDPSLLGEIENLVLYKSVHDGSREHLTSMEFPSCTSRRQTQGVLADEFPHLDIINELLDEEHNVDGAGTCFPTLRNGFERVRGYHCGRFKRGYSSSASNHFDTLREFIPQASPLPYAGVQQIDGLVPTQWKMSSADLSLYGMTNGDGGS